MALTEGEGSCGGLGGSVWWTRLGSSYCQASISPSTADAWAGGAEERLPGEPLPRESGQIMEMVKASHGSVPPAVSFPSDAHFQLSAIFHGPNEKHQNIPRPLAPHPDGSLGMKRPGAVPPPDAQELGTRPPRRWASRRDLTSGLR